MTASPTSDSTPLKHRKPNLKLIVLVLMLCFGWAGFSYWNKSARIVRKLKATYATTTLHFSPNGEILAGGAGSASAELRLWSSETDQLLRTLKTEHNAAVRMFAFSPDGKKIVTTGESDARLFLWNTQTGQKIRRLDGTLWVTNALIFSSDGSFLVNAGHNDKTTVEIWDMRTGRLKHTITGNKGGNVLAGLMPNGKTMLTIGDEALSFWSLQTGKLLHILLSKGIKKKRFIKAALSPNGKTLAVGTRNSQNSTEFIELWDVQLGRRRLLLQENTGNRKAPQNSLLQSLAFSPDSKIIGE